MNYYSFHIGDYVSATRHLTWEEDAAYRRLLDTYYITEQPLPSDSKAVFRLVSATTKTQQKAVQTVLEEFFVLTENGWCNSRADEEIASMKDKRGESQTKKSNKHERTRRHREQRSMMFSALREKGVKPNWDIKIKELEDLYKLHCEDLKRTCNVTGGVTSNAPATAIPIPIPIPIPITNTHTPPPPSREIASTREPQGACFEIPSQAVLENPEPSPEPPPPPTEKPMLPSMAGAICVALKSQGIFDVNPSHPTLRALVDAGVGVDVFVQAAQTAVGKSKGFAYVLGIVKGQMAEAVKMAEAASAQAALAIKSASNNRQHERLSFRERDRELARDRYEEIFGKPHPDRVPKQERTIIDITPSATFLGVEK